MGIYMVLCKIMNNQGQDIPVLLNSKNAIGLQGEKTQALLALANAYKNASLNEFDATVTNSTLQEDKFVKHHLGALHKSLLEKNLLKIILPYSKVEISHVAKLIDLPRDRVEATIS